MSTTINLDIPPEYWKSETWTVHQNLRWAYGHDDNCPVLQQASVSNLGNVRWDDVPSVRLPSPPEASTADHLPQSNEGPKE